VETNEPRFSRRRLLAAGGGLVLGAAGAGALWKQAATGATSLPAPGSTRLEHVVVVMMENRSFDHLLGWLPGANGKQAGLSYPTPTGGRASTYHLTDFQGCGHPDPDHSYEGGRTELDGGAADGWLLDTANDRYAIGYYTQADLPFFGKAAPAWTVCDNYFAAILGPTYPNRIYQHAGTTDRIANSTSTSTLPTIWDRLKNAGLSGAYYYGDIPFLAIWGSKYVGIARRFEQFLADCAKGSLPNVAYVDPRFGGEDQGISNDDHPHADIRAGETLLSQIYDAVTKSPNWPRTLLVVTFDEWGGFFDHVPPTTAADVQPLFAQRGFRVPTLLVSPFARRGVVDHGLYDHTSTLRLIEWRWGLAPLAVRDANARNLAFALDFTSSGPAPAISVPTQPLSAPCAPTVPGGESEWAELARVAATAGWRVG
jgi:phospholipase C